MRILHTADWHLGQRFMNHERVEEHRLALGKILDYIEEKKVELVLIAGDVFDQRNPSNAARGLYFDMVLKLARSCCHHVVIIGGNHDSASMLQTTSELLKYHNVHVIGGASDAIENEILELKDESGELEVVVAAVPFLADKDLRKGQLGETGTERVKKIQEGLILHYEKLANILEENAYGTEVPILGMGHLFAKGSQADDEQANIYLGNRENITAKDFPNIFDYVALGHLHRSQLVNKSEKIRYSGSPIPLSFKEYQYDQGCWFIELDEKKNIKAEFLTINPPRKIFRFSGDLNTVLAKIEKTGKGLVEDETKLLAWCEIEVSIEQYQSDLPQVLRGASQDYPMELLLIRVTGFEQDKTVLEEVLELDNLSALELFKKKCASLVMEKDDTDEMVEAFVELEGWMIEHGDEY